MTLRAMTLQDLKAVLKWAEAEGWNPGIDDAAAFYAADPNGFFLKEHAGAPIAAVSVVNHSSTQAFLGLYLCQPEHRGQGHGMDVWREGLAHAGSRCIGLDGVPDQQDNYARSGFVVHGKTVRYEGHLDRKASPAASTADASDLEALIALDAQVTGVDRHRFSHSWFEFSEHRQTVILRGEGEIAGCATFRTCALGVKVGPLYAQTEQDAVTLLESRPDSMPYGPLFIDVPQHSDVFAQVLKDRGFEPVFETARMYTKTPPPSAPMLFEAIATMELG